MDKVWRRFLLGCLLTVVLMLPIGYLIFQIFPLLGYDDPKDAPPVLGYAVLTVIIVIMLIVSHLATGETYNELQRRRLEKKKRSK
jgi:O-antigen/teichoic acid export membrane protein